MTTNARSIPLLRAYRRLRGILHPLLLELNLSPGQELLIAAIGKHSPTQSELVDTLGVAQPTVARAVKRLTAAGFVETSPDRSDGRIVRIALTSEGLQLLPSIDRAWAAVDAQLLTRLSPDEQHTLLLLLTKIGEPDERP